MAARGSNQLRLVSDFFSAGSKSIYGGNLGFIWVWWFKTIFRRLV